MGSRRTFKPACKVLRLGRAVLQRTDLIDGRGMCTLVTTRWPHVEGVLRPLGRGCRFEKQAGDLRTVCGFDCQLARTGHSAILILS